MKGGSNSNQLSTLSQHPRGADNITHLFDNPKTMLLPLLIIQ
ncbi:hypothetical protein BN938_1630 [Mucinivorans hirudinis]|uniref:Uncharacterized protein n=1 Tax=Mucinivorans hirudinis TaxID=1433126 RepID=A0A060R8D8_9BACT|nr:hypothetical protein BN938_1630 [Mucinivorans hirudinis]